ncbi:hypothetical protein KUL118_01510 [Tenacibaculum sp. KUL118]|nr:hypothetical protein KUL118_01510 [Tenacibaculum sp. KUL118]
MSTGNFPLLRLLIETMEQVVASELPFDIQTYFENEEIPDQSVDIHTCGTAACVAGYGAVNPKIQKFLEVDMPYFRARETAEHVSDSLLDEIGDLAWSIIGSHYEERGTFAGFYLPETELGFNHITKPNPSASDALTYMKHVLAFKERELKRWKREEAEDE